MAALVASEHVHTIVRKHLKRTEVFPSTTGSNNTHNTVTAAIFGNPMLSYPDPSNKSTKKTRKQGLGVTADGVNNTHGGASDVSGEEVSTMHSLRQVILLTQQRIHLFLYLILDMPRPNSHLCSSNIISSSLLLYCILLYCSVMYCTTATNYLSPSWRWQRCPRPNEAPH